MSITKEQLKAYCEPFLKRREFSFGELSLGNRARRALGVAQAFADSKGNPRLLINSLKGAPKTLAEGIIRDSKAPEKTTTPREFSQCVQKHLVAHGVYAEFRRPASVGLILVQREVDGLPVYFLLNEPDPKSHELAYCGRTTFDPLNQKKPTSQIIYVPAAAARLAEMLDIWLRDIPASASEMPLDFMAIRLSEPYLKKWCIGVKDDISDPKDSIVRSALFVIGMRCGIKRLRDLLKDSDSPQDFLIRALNIQLNSVVAHETAHLLERKANGRIMIDKDGKELIAYMLEAKYSYPDIAFLSFLHRYKNELERLVPRFVKDMRENGVMAMLENEDYLRGWASELLDSDFVQLTGKVPEELIDVSALQRVQTSDFVSQKHLPLLERAIYNPSATA
ncbi:MAG: hypothetical protein PHF60_00515 [Candidatus ainarchaeum sp.]|nr:hypothetical protein [Candidatus ainarchaeum sp.]